MYILDVMPLTKSVKKETLRYFSLKEVSIGALVSIEIRKRVVSGLVIGVQDGSHMKAEIKSQSFSLKRVRGISKNNLFQKQFLIAAHRMANYFATSTGAVLGALVPAKILPEIDKLKPPREQTAKHRAIEQTERYVIQDQFDERYANYKSLIRESFARKTSILFLCPTAEDVQRTGELLTKGIEDHTFTFSSTMTPKQMVTAWNKAVTHERPVLIIATGTFLAIPRHDIDTIIIEKESAQSYRQQQMPYLDIRTCAELYAQTIGARFFLSDLALRTETLARYDNHEFIEKGALKFRALTTAEAKIIDMKPQPEERGRTFSVFADEIIDTLIATKENNEHTVLFTARRGLAPSIVCSDCGTLVSCTRCSAPMVLYGKDPTEGGNVFRCHVCGDERHAGEKCTHCDGWRLKMLGISVGTVEQALKESQPDITYFILDSEHAKTAKQARAIVEAFYAHPGSVLIATEMAISYLHEDVENTLVVSVDSLLSLPDYAIRERILRTLLRLRSRTTKRFFITTRKAEDSLFEYARQGNLADFYREEFKDRKKFIYPPFTRLIKLSVAGTPKATEQAMLDAQAVLQPFELLIYPAFTERQRGKSVWNGIMKLKADEWPNDELRKKLMALPPQFKVLVDAPSLL